jgi:hypothetical protein
MGGELLTACIDTDATFTLLAERTYQRLQDKLLPLCPAQVSLSGAGGESLNVRETVLAEFGFGQEVYTQWLQGLDLLLGMDWLTTYGVTIDCASRAIRVRGGHVQFGQVLTVHSKEFVRMAKTVRICSRGVLCYTEDLTRAGKEVLVEGTTKLGGNLFVVPTLEVVRDDGSIPLTLENQGTSFREVEKGLVLAKITELPVKDATGVKQTSEGGESPPAM